MAIIRCEARAAGSEQTEYLPCQALGISFSYEDTFIGEFFRIVRARIKNESGQDFLGILHIKLLHQKQEPKFYLPGYLYNRNTSDKPSSGRKPFPRLKAEPEGMPESSWWMTRSDRLAEPMSLVYDSGRVWGIAAAPYWVGNRAEKKPAGMSDPHPQLYQYSGFTCDLGRDEFASVGYTLGYENAPWLFVQTAKVLERAEVSEENAFHLAKDEQVSFSFYVYDYSGENELSVMRAVEHAYAVFHQSPRSIPGMNPRKAVEMLSEAVRDYAWLEGERMYSGFVYDRPEGYAYNKIFSLSWTNGLSVAVPMLMVANKLGDAQARAQSLSCIAELLRHSCNRASGLLNDAVWTVRGWWYNGMHSGGHSGYLNGQAVYYLLKAYLSEEAEQGIVHEEWLSTVSPVVEKLNRIKNSDDEYPFVMSDETGAGLEYDSMGSAWCLAATALYAQVTGDHRFDAGMHRSEQHYYDKFVRKMECYGGPLDTDKAVDSEGILAYIRAVRILHSLFGEEHFLSHLRDAIAYESTFKLGYNTPVQVRPLSEIGWSSCGGSITSTANPHIHPMSSTVISEMKYLTEQMSDEYVRSRLCDTIGWSLQTFNVRDGEYGYGKIGWMSERFCFCQGLLTERYPNGEPASTWFALMPWASASIIEGLVSLL